MKKKKLVIFGRGDIAELAHFYFVTDSNYEVCAFTVDRNFIGDREYLGLPVYEFETLEEVCPPSEFELFIALSYSKLNQIRRERFETAVNMGYQLASYVSSAATVLNDGGIGDNCFILEDNTIQPFVKIGNNVTLWSGNHIGHHSIINDHCFVASHVVISGGVQVGAQSFIGVNATFRDHISVGEKCIVGAGALVMQDVPSETLVKGTPSSFVSGAETKAIDI